MLNKELIKAWIKELRSGKYEQGRGFLRQRKAHQKAQYCCLGILCELVYTDKQDKELRMGYGKDEYKTMYDRQTRLLPKKVIEKLGLDLSPSMADISLDEELPKTKFLIKKYHTQKTLSSLNDNGATFKEIAAVIKENFLK